MQQHLLAGLQGAELEQVEPGGGIYLGQRRRLGQRQALRRRQGVAAVDHHFRGHATPGEQRADAVAHLPLRTGADLGHHAGALQAEDVAGPGWRGVEPGLLQQVGAVDPGRRHANADLPGATGRTRPFSPDQLPLDALQCFHAASIVIPDARTACRANSPLRAEFFCRVNPAQPDTA
ncbi:hypothetical protein D9M71_561690 [compost metagenome]